jgi:hypothetical protein
LIKYLFLSTLICIVLVFSVACREDIIVQPERPVASTSLMVRSAPTGASIFLDGEFTNLLTPANLENVNVGIRRVKLKLDGYLDTTLVLQLNDSTHENIFVLLTGE